MILNTYYRQIAMRSMLLFVTAIITLSVSAIPAKPGLKRLLTLTDGTTIEARLVGDEHGHYWLGTDGKAYRETTDGKTYQLVDAEQVKQQAQVRRDKINQQRAKRMPGAKRAAGTSSISGEKKGIIILVNFADDVKFKDGNDNAYFQLIANKENFQDDYFYGSVHDYFYKQSEGKFNLNFDVAGPYTLDHEMAYYGANSGGNDVHPAEMVIEACKQANKDVDFSQYDWDSDGEVDQVYVIYAGKSENEGGDDDTIWPHEWTLSSAKYYGDGEGPQTLDGVTIDTYACGSELNGQGAICGIGTICHEFSHCLGYPDYYDTDYSGGQGMGYWDLMDSGSYNGGGYCPAGYTSYERWAAGWIEPIELTTTTKVEYMKALQDEASAYIIYNDGNRNEFFLLENRQFIDWDRGLPGSGLLILHCDYNANVWNNNKPNDDPSHQRMTWIPADNKYESFMYNGEKYYDWEGMMTDTYPYTSNTGQIINNAFSATTTPAAKFYNKNKDKTYFMSGAVLDITQNTDGTVSFRYKGLSNVPTPTFSPAAGTYTEAQTVTISCSDAEATIYYTTDGKEPSQSSAVYTEPIFVETTTTLKAMAVSTGGEESDVATARFIIRNQGAEINTFRRVTSASDLVSGQRCIIARGDKGVAAGALSNKFLSKVSVDVDEEGIITINDNVLVFTLNGSGNSFSFQTDDGDYLYAIKTKELGFSNEEKTWTLGTESNELIMEYGSYGQMLYNSLTPRFTTYTSGTNNRMFLAQIYVEYKPTPTPPPTPVEGIGIYELVTSDDMLEVDRNYLIVSTYGDANYSYNGFKTNKGEIGKVAFDSNGCIDMEEESNTALPVVLSGSANDGWLLYDINEKAYVGTTNVTTSSDRSKAYLTTSAAANSDYYKWTININDNIATLGNKGKEFYLKFNYNFGTPMFRVYASGQNDIMLYKEIPVKEEIGITTGAELQEKVQRSKIKVQSESWYTIDGRKLSGKPTKKGVYIQNGQKRIVK